MEKAPDAFRTISEVADYLDVPQHVLRFWETRFPQIKPMKRGGGRRYYRPDDVDLLRGIRHLLYGEGYTIRGVQRLLKDNGLRFVQGIGRQEEAAPGNGQAGAPAGPHESSFEAESESDLEEPAFEEAEHGETDREEAEPARGGVSHTGPTMRTGATAVAPAGLTADDRSRLQEALQELAECRRLIDAALKGE